MSKNFFLILLGILLIPLVSADVTLEVTGFSCSPNEVVVANQFTCTATVYNSGTETASLTDVILYPDSSNWLEYSSYSEVANVEISSGASTEIVFENLRAQKSGTYGFSRVALGEAIDTYPADNNIEVNVIDLVTIVTQSANSAAASVGTIDVTGQVNVGGSADIVMSLSILSGGCSIGSQPGSTSFNDVTDGQSISYTWTLTMGTRNCNYKITSVATSNPLGIASKTDSTSKTITCTGTTCVVGSTDDDTTTSSSSGGGGGGASTKKPTNVTNLSDVLEYAYEFEVEDEDVVVNLNKIDSWKDEGKVEFSDVAEGTIYSFTFINSDLDKEKWLIVVKNINIDSQTVVFFLKYGDNVLAEVFDVSEGIEFDLDSDGINDLKITLQSLNGDVISFSVEKSESFISKESQFSSKRKIIIWSIIIVASVLVGILIILGIYFHFKKRKLVRDYSRRK